MLAVVHGLALWALWIRSRRRAGRVLGVFSSPSSDRLAGWVLTVAGIILIADELRTSWSSPSRLIIGAIAVAGGLGVDRLSRKGFSVSENGILRFPSLIPWADIECVRGTSDGRLAARLQKRPATLQNVRGLFRRELDLTVPPDETAALRRLIQGRGISIGSGDE